MKPKIWLRYIDDIFIIWSYGTEELNIFLCYLNSQYSNIKFIIEISSIYNCLPFLDVLIERNQNLTFSHSVYRKPTHNKTDISLITHNNTHNI